MKKHLFNHWVSILFFGWSSLFGMKDNWNVVFLPRKIWFDVGWSGGLIWSAKAETYELLFIEADVMWVNGLLIQLLPGRIHLVDYNARRTLWFGPIHSKERQRSHLMLYERLTLVHLLHCVEALYGLASQCCCHQASAASSHFYNYNRCFAISKYSSTTNLLHPIINGAHKLWAFLQCDEQQHKEISQSQPTELHLLNEI